jgi:hypothetical protein
VYDLSEFVSNREIELSMKKYLAVVMADRLIFFSPRVQELCWDLFPRTQKIPQIVLSPAIPVTLAPNSPQPTTRPYLVIDDASVSPGMTAGIDHLLLALSQVPECPPVVFPYSQPDSRTLGFAASLGVQCEVYTHSDTAAYYQLIQAAQAVLVPHATPLFDGVTVDALLCGTPIISSKSAGNPLTTGGCSIELDSFTGAEVEMALRTVLQPTIRSALRQQMEDRVTSFRWHDTVNSLIRFVFTDYIST